jgi:hypothetical protein
MNDRYDIFGTLSDIFEDDWIKDEEELEAPLKNIPNVGGGERVRSQPLQPSRHISPVVHFKDDDFVDKPLPFYPKPVYRSP